MLVSLSVKSFYPQTHATMRYIAKTYRAIGVSFDGYLFFIHQNLPPYTVINTKKANIHTQLMKLILIGQISWRVCERLFWALSH